MNSSVKQPTNEKCADKTPIGGTGDASVIRIPRSSFTAFRLAYLAPQQIAEASRCVFLGIVPHIWLADESKGLFANIMKRAKGQVRAGLRETMTMMNFGVKNRGRQNMSWFFSEDARAKELLKLLEENDGASSDDEADVSSVDSAQAHNTSLYRHPTGALAMRSYAPVPESGSESEQDQAENSGPPTARSSGNLAAGSEINLVSPDFTSSTVTEQDERFDAAAVAPEESNTLRLPEGEAFDGSNRTSMFSARSPNVKFEPDVAPRHQRQPITVAKPEPLDGAPELFRIEKFHKRFNARLRSFAKVSRGKAKKTTSDFSWRVHRTIIGNFKVGEIIQESRALTLIKEAYKTSQSIILTEDESCDTRVLDRWREYSTVLRKVDDESLAVTLQIYKFNEKGREDSPEYNIPLGPGVDAALYNDADKSICLSVSGGQRGMKFYILKFRTQAESVRWLYFIKQLLYTNTSSYFHVSVPDLNLMMDIRVPEKILLDVLKELHVQEVGVLDKGYKVDSTPLLQYLKDVIAKKLKELDHGAWYNSLARPWFCFRQYDRLEWVGDDSEIFFMKNYLFKSIFQLELRDIAQQDSEKKAQKPVPIEGFLARLSTMAGSEQNLVRTFYKVAYFYTCEDVLFFTKYYKGIPPSPDNVMIMENQSNKDFKTILPMIYHHSCYDIDENQHIPWLPDTQKFEENDKAAFVEFERKSELITKADAAIDICNIVDIKPVPIQSVKLQHKIYLSLLWYQKANMIKDDDILDSCFDIITSNGGFIRLQAPNRKTREEWVTRLLQLKDYWVARRQADLNALLQTRKTNLALLRINEYRDSNITHQVGLDEMKRSVAHPTSNITHITVETPLLHSGYLYQKLKKHADFNQYFVALTNGNLTLYSLFKRSKVTGEWKRGVYYKHFLSLPLDECYIYSGYQTEIDLLDRDADHEQGDLFDSALPRLYVDGWKSQEEEPMRCFTVRFGKKRAIKQTATDQPKNPNLIKLTMKLGVTGASVVFMARSRQERELWVSSILAEIDRYTAIRANSAG